MYNMIKEAVYFWVMASLTFMACAYMWCYDVINANRIVGLFVITLFATFELVSNDKSEGEA